MQSTLNILDYSSRSEGVVLFYDEYGSAQFIEQDLTSGAVLPTGANPDAIILSDHDDLIDLSGSNTTLVAAGNGNDVVFGSYSDDIIDGGAGDDLLSGNTGNDTLITGEGSDIVFVKRDTTGPNSSGFGMDVVEDFDFNFDKIAIEVDWNATYDPMLDLVQTEDGALLTYADDSSLLLKGVDVDDLDLDHFLIVPEAVALFG